MQSHFSKEIQTVRTNASVYVNEVLKNADKKEPATVTAVAELLKAYKSLIEM